MLQSLIGDGRMRIAEGNDHALMKAVGPYARRDGRGFRTCPLVIMIRACADGTTIFVSMDMNTIAGDVANSVPSASTARGTMPR